jgi:hypothetical protein
MSEHDEILHEEYAMSKTTHTPGKWTHSKLRNFTGTLISFIEVNGRQVAQSRHDPDDPHAEGDARLIAAACTEFDKVFGPNAVAAAEGGKLGEAVELLRSARDKLKHLQDHPEPMIQINAKLLDEDIDAFLSTTKDKP